MNRDGSFNVVRGGVAWRDFFHPYHRLLTMSWGAFFGLIVVAYLAVNLTFALAYLACGTGALAGGESPSLVGRFGYAFFFSVQTLATIGYGKITPEGLAANLVVSVEALVGLLGFALATGLLFARFSRPSAKIVFSDVAVLAPYRDKTGLMFRLANARASELTDARVTVTLSREEENGGKRTRKFHQLELERTKVMFLPTQWVVVHPIDEASPLWGVAEGSFRGSDPEILILLTAMDETFSQTVLTRSSYKGSEVVWGARFRDIYEKHPNSSVYINLKRLGEVDRAALPER